MTATTRRILYVDPDFEARMLMQALLATEELHAAEHDQEARLLVRHHSYDVYILGGGAPGSTTLELCAWLHRVDPCTPIVFCSSNASATYQQLALEAGALRYQLKPLDPIALKSTLGLLLKLGHMESDRATAAAQQAIVDELRIRSGNPMPLKPQQMLDCMLRVKAYRAFRDAGGNRANFERRWSEAMDDALASAKPCEINPPSASRDKP
jgi:CheY-like chemotaxis protein